MTQKITITIGDDVHEVGLIYTPPGYQHDPEVIGMMIHSWLDEYTAGDSDD